MSSYYMELLEEPLNFPPVSKEINVFFDECNRQVFAVSTQGTYFILMINLSIVTLRSLFNQIRKHLELTETGPSKFERFSDIEYLNFCVFRELSFFSRF